MKISHTKISAFFIQTGSNNKLEINTCIWIICNARPPSKFDLDMH